MARRWVADYPEAASERAKYDSIVNRLSAESIKIRNAANVSICHISALLDSVGSLDGDYYSEYDKRVKDWYYEEKRIVDAFKNFASELNTRISNARSKSIMWANRESMGHWEEID